MALGSVNLGTKSSWSYWHIRLLSATEPELREGKNKRQRLGGLFSRGDCPSPPHPVAGVLEQQGPPH